MQLVPWAVVGSAIVVACAIGVFWSVRSFVQDWKERRMESENAWESPAFESKPVADRVRELRQNPLQALSGRMDDEWQRKERLAKARRRVDAGSYFQHAHAEWAEAQMHSTAL